MSDSDDWEKGLDSDYEEEQKAKETEVAAKKNAAFDDEDKVDAEKKKAELEKAAKIRIEQELEENKRLKKHNKVDYDAAFEKRQQALAGIKPTEDVDTTGMSKGAKGMILEMDAERGLADQLFGGMDLDAPVGKIALNSEKEYKNFGMKTGQLLYQGSAPYRVENFFRELCKDLPEHCDSKQIQKVVDFMSIMQKALAKKEKEARDGKNKKKPKASIGGGGGKMGDDLTQTAMVNDVMGMTGDYGDYGDEGGFAREAEGEYDFM